MKTKRILALLISVTMLFSFVTIPASAENTAEGWDGVSVSTEWYTANPDADEFYINSEAELAGFAQLVNEGTQFFSGKTVILESDMYLNNYEWTPIGRATGNFKDISDTKYENDFEGSFDGGNHTIYDLNVNVGDRRAGFFGQAISNGEVYEAYIKDLNFHNVSVVNTYNTTSSVTSNSKTNVGYAGALVGRIEKYTVSNINVTGSINISGYSFVGGLIGHCSAVVNDCHINAYGNIEANNWQCGALIGSQNRSDSSVINSSVVGDAENGGIAVYAYNGAIAGIVGSVQNEGVSFENNVVKNVSLSASYPKYGAGYVIGAGAENSNISDCKAGNVTLTNASGDAVVPGDMENIEVYVAKIGEVFYTSLEDAVNNIADGDIIELIADVELDKSLHINQNISFTIEGNGYTVKPLSISEYGTSSMTDSVFNFGNSGSDDTIALRTYNVKNIVFDGWTTDHVVRIEGATSLIEGCTFVNTNQPDGLGIVTSTMSDVTVKDCVFTDNVCVKCIDINSNAGKSTSSNVIDNCIFTDNVCSNVGVVYYHAGTQTTVSNSKFIGNEVNTSGSGATIYMGFNDGIKVVNNIIEDNTVVSAGTGTNLAGGLFAGFADDNCLVTGNVFADNSASNAASSVVGQDATFSSYYAPVSADGNYWNGGNAPVMGDHIFTKHEGENSNGNYSVALDTYLSSYETDANGNVVPGEEKTIVAVVNGIFYPTLKEAFDAVNAGDVIELYPGAVINEGTVKLPATLTNVTLKGNDTAVIKDTTIMSADGSSYQYSGLTVDGVKFDNSNVVITGWRTGTTVLENITFKNNTFSNIYRTSNYASVHINVDQPGAVKNFVFENNVIDGITGSSNSGIYIATDGDVVIKNNVIKNVAFRPFIIQVIDNNGTADTLSVIGNTFAGSPAGRLQAYGVGGGDSVVIDVNENIITGTTDSQQICFWSFDAENTSFDFSNNYYEYNPVDNFNKFYINGTASSYEDLDSFDVLPYYTELNADGTINTDSLYTGITEGISVEFKEVKELAEEDSLVYDIVFKAHSAEDAAFINRLNSADLTFALKNETGENAYEIVDIANDNITFNPVYDNETGKVIEGRYEFHFEHKDGVTNDTGKELVIGRVKFTGYGKFNFGIASSTTNGAYATTIDDNIVESYFPAGTLNSDKILYIDNDITGAQIAVPKRELTIKVDFPNNIEAGEFGYQDMRIIIEGPENYKKTIELGDGFEGTENLSKDGCYYQVVVEKELTLNSAYTVTVEGAGYRTAKYTVSMTENKTLNFWNNVKDNDTYIEVSESGVKKNAVKTNFLAGDIVKDNNINVYDLSAVVSYFGEINLDKDNKPQYAKYDLNRDGKVDSKDVAYVLVSWGN